ncbi:MAG: addiction module protein [Rubrivivax sp.]
MNADLAELEKLALGLTESERAELAYKLLQSLDGGRDADAEELWLDIAARRAAEIDAGTVQLVSAAELESRVQAIPR